MPDIIQAFRTGTNTERLAIASDLFSIIGISAAAILAPIFTLDLPSDPDALMGPPIICLVTLASLSIVLALTIGITGILKVVLEDHPLIFWPFAVAIWSLFAAVVVLAVVFAFHLVTTTRW